MAVVHLEQPKFKGYVQGTNTPLEGGKVYIYDAGTSDLATVYTSQDAGTEHTNPVILDANGEAEIWYNSNVKVVVKDSDDVQQYSFDNIVSTIEPTVSGVYNLVQTGGFETDSNSDGEPDNWTLAADTSGTIAIDATVGNHANGSNSLKFTSGGFGGGSATTTPYSEVTAGDDVQVIFRLKSSIATVKNIVTVLWYQNDAGLASSTASTAVYTDTATNPTSWTYKSFSASVPADAFYAKIKLEGVESSGTTITTGANTHYDDVRLYQGPVIFPNVEGPVTASETELNILDGATLSTAEINILDGVTATFDELNYADTPNTATKFCLLDSNAEVAADQMLAGSIVQVQSVNNLTEITGSTAIPADNTIPQITEGIEAVTLDFTPVFSDSILNIECSCPSIITTPTYAVIALFADGAADAIAAELSDVSTYNYKSLYHRMVSGGTSTITFDVRFGPAVSNSITINGDAILGGVTSSSITITEVKV